MRYVKERKCWSYCNEVVDGFSLNEQTDVLFPKIADEISMFTQQTYAETELHKTFIRIEVQIRT